MAELAELVRRRAASPAEITRALLERIERVDPALNAFVTVTAEAAMESARQAEAALERGASIGPLHGVPVALKDLFETAGVRTTGGSRVLADRVPAADATCVARLRQAGAILVGKTATHEFAFGPTTDSPFHGPTRNPWNTQHSPAGSSGGSGAAVAAGVVPCAMGTFTGGSIRMPAGVCGVVGLKPPFGRVSKAGILPLSWSLDHPGPLCRSVLDAALVLGAIAGPDPLDPAAARAPVDAMVLVNRIISLSEGGAYHSPTRLTAPAAPWTWGVAPVSWPFPLPRISSKWCAWILTGRCSTRLVGLPPRRA